MLRRHWIVLILLALPVNACHKATVLQSTATTQFEKVRATHEAKSKNYIIATQGEASSRAGKTMLEDGGNIVDAAVAIAFAIAVERPKQNSIGGGGFMLLHLADMQTPIAIDYRETAPKAAKAKMFLDDKDQVRAKASTDGILAGAVPGLVAGLLEIHDKYGKLGRQKVMAPAIAVAEQGFIVEAELHAAIKDRQEVLLRYPASKKLFFRADGTPLQVGDRLIQVELAATLKTIAQEGRSGFYKGWVAKAFLAEQKRLGGIITQADLDGYKVKYRQPVVGEYKGYRIYSMPPPSSGGIHVIEILNILAGENLRGYGALDPRSVHLTAAAMQMAFADRSEYLGDPDFVEVPVKGLTSKKYAASLRQQIPSNKARSRDAVKPGQPQPYESDETTHFSVMDAAGNIIVSTQTSNGPLASGVIVPRAGFMINNEMDDFVVKPGAANMWGAVGADKNAIAPDKRPLSSMSPTIVMKDNTPIAGMGSSAGTRIISCVVLTALNLLEYQMPLFEAVATPRYHHQWTPDEIRVDAPSFPPATSKRLEEMGYKINVNDLACKVQAVARQGDWLYGVAEPRADGLAIGGD